MKVSRTNFALGVSLIGAGWIVYYVHRSQTAERERMRRGPIRDVMRRQQEKLAKEKNDSASDQ